MDESISVGDYTQLAFNIKLQKKKGAKGKEAKLYLGDAPMEKVEKSVKLHFERLYKTKTYTKWSTTIRGSSNPVIVSETSIGKFDLFITTDILRCRTEYSMAKPGSHKWTAYEEKAFRNKILECVAEQL